MSQGMTVPASDFSRNFARYQDEAIAARVINVTSHGRVVGAFLSAAEFAHYELLKRREREMLTVGDLDDATIAAIEASEYGAEPK
jgi:predicted dinucleotide-binding enzyme